MHKTCHYCYNVLSRCQRFDSFQTCSEISDLCKTGSLERHVISGIRTMPTRTRHSTRLDELPEELIQTVVDHVFHAGERTYRSLLQLSLTCRHIRVITLRYLFNSKTLDLCSHSSNALRLLTRKDADFVFNASGEVLANLTHLELICWQRFPYVYMEVSYLEALDSWKTLASRCTRLRTLR